MKVEIPDYVGEELYVSHAFVSGIYFSFCGVSCSDLLSFRGLMQRSMQGNQVAGNRSSFKEAEGVIIVWRGL